MKAFLLLGSNVGDRFQNFSTALGKISEEIGSVINMSGVYETAPWGNKLQAPFLNRVIVIDTRLEPKTLLKKIKSIESALGRKEIKKWGPRIIDIDILLMEDLVYESGSLVIPHPQMHLRRFTLVPLAEIASDLVHPVFRMTIRELLSGCTDTLEVNGIHATDRSHHAPLSR